MLTKKQIKENLKHTKEIERMLLQFLSDPQLPEDQAHMVVGELLVATDFIVRFEEALHQIEIMDTEDKYKKGDK